MSLRGHSRSVERDRRRRRSVSPNLGSIRAAGDSQRVTSRTSQRRAKSTEELLRDADAARRRATDAGYRTAIRRYDDALDRLREAGGQPTAVVQACSSRASCCKALGEYSMAVEDLSEALRLPVPRARKSALFVQRAELHLTTGSIESAKQDLRKAIKLSSEATPGGLAYSSHSRAIELLERLNKTRDPKLEPGSNMSATHGVVVAEFGPEDRHLPGWKPLGISFESTAGGRGLQVAGIAIGSPAQQKYPKLGPGCLLVGVKSSGESWVDLTDKSSTRIWSLLNQRVGLRGTLALKFSTTRVGMHWDARREQWMFPLADERGIDVIMGPDPLTTSSTRTRRHDYSPDASRIQVLPGVNLTQVLSSLHLYGKRNPGEMRFSDFEKAYRQLFGTTEGVASQFMELRDEEVSALRNGQRRAAPHDDHHESELDFGVVLVDDFHSWIRGQATAVRGVLQGQMSAVQDTSGWADRSPRSRSHSPMQETPVRSSDVRHRTVRTERSPRSRSHSPMQETPVRSSDVRHRTVRAERSPRSRSHSPMQETPVRSSDVRHRTVRAERSPRSRSHSPMQETPVRSSDVRSRYTERSPRSRLRSPIHEPQSRHGAANYRICSKVDHSTPLNKTNDGRRFSEHHAKAFDKVQKKAVKALQKGITGLHGRSAMRYMSVEQRDAVFESNEARCQLTVWNEAKSHRFERLQVVRSKLIRLASVSTSSFDDRSPRHFFQELEQTDRGTFEKLQFVHAVHSASSDFEPKLSALARITTSELVDLFTALDTHGTGLVPVEAIEVFVFGDVGVYQSWQRQQQQKPEWQYPISHGWLDTTPRTLRLDLSMIDGPPALIIAWRSQEDNSAQNGTDLRFSARKPTNSVVSACCAAPEQRSSRRIPSTSACGSTPRGKVEQGVRISLSEVRSVIFGAATDLTLTPGAHTFDHWNSFSLCTSDTRWEFACTAAQDARSCFLALQAVLAPTTSAPMEKLWGRILWHSARARFRTLAAVLQLPHSRTMAAVVAHPKQPRRRKPIDRMRHQTLADLHLKQRQQRQNQLQKADGQVLESDWVDGSRFRTSRLPPGVCVDVQGYGRGEVVSTSTDALDEPVHTIQFEHANTTEHKSLKLQHTAGGRGLVHSNLPFLVEVAKLC